MCLMVPWICKVRMYVFTLESGECTTLCQVVCILLVTYNYCNGVHVRMYVHMLLQCVDAATWYTLYIASLDCAPAIKQLACRTTLYPAAHIEHTG